jgi:hypothetical protein
MAIGKQGWMAGVLAVVLTAPAPALAQGAPGGGDEVTLRNGGVLRGTVVSNEPGKEVVIVILGLGETRRVPWAEVDRVNRQESPPGAPFPGVALTPVDLLPPPQPNELGAPLVHIESDAPVSLHEATVSLDGRRRPVVCRTPCDTVIDGRSGRAFYFAGDEIPESSRFLLTEKSGAVSVRVSPGNEALQPAGTTFLTLGILGASTGAVLLPIGLAINASRSAMATSGSPFPAADTKPSPLPLVGGVMLGASAAMITVGIVMKVFSATRYEFRQAGAPPSAPPRAVLEPGVLRF